MGFSVAVSVTFTCSAYYALYGIDQQFYPAAAFAVLVPILCSLPVGYYLTVQGHRLQLLNAELSASREQMIRLNDKL
ncbi:MAG: hypothetical protein AAFX04_07700 [Pseudomonadota bacterium]